MTAYLIPLSGEPETFCVTLAGVEYQFTLRWCDAAQGGWLLDIALPDDGGDVLSGLALITGADLLEPHGHLGLGGKLVVWSETSDLAPDQETLGTDVQLYFILDEAAS